jgi:hypothetical protein
MNIKIAELKRAKSSRGTSVSVKRIRGSDGKRKRVLSLDAYSPTFIDDLTTVFEMNVAKARRNNKRLLGSADGRRARK